MFVQALLAANTDSSKGERGIPCGLALPRPMARLVMLPAPMLWAAVPYALGPVCPSQTRRIERDQRPAKTTQCLVTRDHTPRSAGVAGSWWMRVAPAP